MVPRVNDKKNVRNEFYLVDRWEMKHATENLILWFTHYTIFYLSCLNSTCMYYWNRLRPGNIIKVSPFHVYGVHNIIIYNNYYITINIYNNYNIRFRRLWISYYFNHYLNSVVHGCIANSLHTGMPKIIHVEHAGYKQVKWTLIIDF